MDPSTVVGKALDPKDVELVATRGSGPGGQHRNKTESCIIATHLPTGISARIDLKSQHQSRQVALQVLAARIYEVERQKVDSARSDVRKGQVGTGQRGDKIRTYRTQDDQVTDHRSGQKWKLTKWLKGDW